MESEEISSLIFFHLCKVKRELCVTFCWSARKKTRHEVGVRQVKNVRVSRAMREGWQLFCMFQILHIEEENVPSLQEYCIPTW